MVAMRHGRNGLFYFLFLDQGCQIFSVQHTKTGKRYTKEPKMYQMAIHLYNLAVNRQHDHKKYQHLPLQDLLKFTQIGIFGLKIYHLATLFIPGQY
jgi:capsular polysaccharide biosynthesis protein